MDFPEYRDQYFFDREVLLKECLPALHVYENVVDDYYEFFKGKIVSMLGFPTEDKVWLRKFILLNGGKAYHKRLDKPDIVIFGHNFWYFDMLNIYEHQQQGENIIVINYATIMDNIDPIWEVRIKEYDKEEEEKKNANEKKYCDEAYLSSLNWVKSSSISLYDDVFLICGKLYDYDICPISHEQVYEKIKAKFGQVIKKNKQAVTCVVMGTKVMTSTLSGLDENVKYIDYHEFIPWLDRVRPAYPDLKEFGKKYFSCQDARLRPYQQDVKDKIFTLWKSEKNVMLQMPTGAGKTILFSSVINDIIKVPDSKILIIAHRKELLEQISSHLSKYNIEHGIISSNRKRCLEKRVQVASIQTLTHKNNEEITKSFVPNFIVIDEAHHTLAKTYDQLWKLYPLSWKLGVTATPCRINGAPFTNHFSELISSLSVKELIEKGFLSDYTFYTENPDSDLSKAILSIKKKSSTGDYRINDLLQNLNVERHVKKLVLSYSTYANGLKGIVYCISIEHAHNICEAYKNIGVVAEYIDSKTPKTEREQIVQDFKDGKIQVLVNVDIFSEGFDCPDVEFIQMARPTWSLSKYMQQVGRGLRTSPGKDKTIILDNAGMYARFGLPSDTRLWNATFAGVDFRDHYIGSVGSKNCYLRLKYENSSQLMLLVYNDGKDVYSMEDEVIEEEVDIAPETNDLSMQNLNTSEIQPAVCEESVISDTDGKVESTKDHVSDEEDISLPKTKKTSPIMADVHEATGEAETYINAYSNKGKTSTHNSEAKKTYNERNSAAGKGCVKALVAILITAIILVFILIFGFSLIGVAIFLIPLLKGKLK
ncbi:DEAD/DEAH box helicase [Segatella copri]|uniref:DEAD/DEAH box helicase n=1 Tax=Segatella copri TaxID=165179 RepID=UPI00294B5567|nr:DEAD/DEAH box helicase [Segatella copri]WOG05572.1 DEAD/DEAH box helicase [Segatella copri]